jgi:large subunit ribosomal protein L23
MVFNIFKRKPPSFVPSESRGTTKGKPSFAKATEGKEEAKKPVSKRTVGVNALSLPHITEKAGALGEQNQYVFKVIPGATKYAVRDSVEAHYGAQVAKVRMITVPSKSIRVGRRMGKRPGYKKAVVTLKQGHTIETGA